MCASHRHCENAQAVAEFLQQHEKVAWVNFPRLPGNKYYAAGAEIYAEGHLRRRLLRRQGRPRGGGARSCGT